jgi:hypothetical protein
MGGLQSKGLAVFRRLGVGCWQGRGGAFTYPIDIFLIRLIIKDPATLL